MLRAQSLHGLFLALSFRLVTATEHTQGARYHKFSVDMLVAPCTAQATDTGTIHAMGNVEERPSLQRLEVYSSVWQRGLSMRSRCPQSSDHIASARPTVCDSHWACALPRCALHEHRACQRYHETAHRSWRALLSSSVRRALSTRKAPLGRVSCAERWCSCSGGTGLKTAAGEHRKAMRLQGHLGGSACEACAALRHAPKTVTPATTLHACSSEGSSHRSAI